MKVLFPVSQLGLAAYMFVVGLEFRVDIVRTADAERGGGFDCRDGDALCARRGAGVVLFTITRRCFRREPR